MRRPLLATLVIGAFVPHLAAQEAKRLPQGLPTPTVAKLAYGDHERQVLDFWKAESKKPAPLVLFIHGGSWRGGDKSSVGEDAVAHCLAAGISVAAINYRYIQNAVTLKIEPPVKAPLGDAARALQFIRSKANEWNLDKKRIAATGPAAGGCSALWLAFHDDLADFDSDDPVARESTRLHCAAVVGAQTSLDPKELREWIPNYGYGGHAFGLGRFQEFHDGREKIARWLKEYSPIEHVSRDDPPIFLDYPAQKAPPIAGLPQDNPTHSAVLGVKLAEKMKKAGVEAILVYPGRTHAQYKNATMFLIDRLRK